MGNEVSSEITKEDLIEIKKKQLKLEKENKKIKEELEKNKKQTNPPIKVKPIIPNAKSNKKVSFTINNKELTIDPYEIFQLEPDCSLEDVKQRYKKLVIKYHPDKSGYDSKEEYRAIQKSYALLLSIKEDEAKISGLLTQTKESKESERKNLDEDLERVNYQFEPASGNNFNRTRFNQMFEQNRFVDETDKGYNDWLKDDSNFASEQPKIASKEKFNEAFNEYIQRQASTKQIIEYIDPETLISTTAGYEELGNDYSDFTNHGKYTDLKKAYSESTLHPGAVKSRDNYKNIDELKAARSGSMVLTDQEREYLNKKQQNEEQYEMNRQNKMRNRDSAIEQHYTRIHGRAIELPQYKR